LAVSGGRLGRPPLLASAGSKLKYPCSPHCNIELVAGVSRTNFEQ